MSDSEHWSTPRGCHPDCPACNECDTCSELRAENAELRARNQFLEEQLGTIRPILQITAENAELKAWSARAREAYRHVHLLKTWLDIYRQVEKDRIDIAKIYAPVEMALAALDK